jgi:hypothetical protein
MIAAAHMAAHVAHPQMHPGVAGFQAIFAALGAGGDIMDLIQMRTLFRHSNMPPEREAQREHTDDQFLSSIL